MILLVSEISSATGFDVGVVRKTWDIESLGAGDGNLKREIREGWC